MRADGRSVFVSTQVIVDNTATGSTLQANQLSIVDVITNSSTFLCANRNVSTLSFALSAVCSCVIIVIVIRPLKTLTSVLHLTSL